ncbi:hypothetical protein ABW636_14130 [Aquimarina sp. 2201CG1-2-11]|uniref:hypothetical protein n=1 Tax=Aquimarina discodermiae TaxID=3231043 RepID=UPI00346260BF
MKKVKNYIAPDLAKKKIARYKYWSIKDENGVTITSSEDAQEGRSFADLLDKIITDNVDAEVQVKFGTNEQSSRQNTPIFIRINEAIEWIEPEEEETIKINGVPHKLDKNGNVNINLSTPTIETPIIESPSDMMRQEMELQLEGLRKEGELKEQRYQADLHNKLAEQTLKFKEMMLQERENRIAEREQDLIARETILEERDKEMSENIKGYAKHIPNVLGGLVKQWLGTSTETKATLGKTETPKRERKKVSFEFADEAETEPDTNIYEDNFLKEQETPELQEETIPQITQEHE